MFTNTIRKGVMSVINERIEQAEENYKKGCQELEAKLEAEKDALADVHINSILGKIL